MSRVGLTFKEEVIMKTGDIVTKDGIEYKVCEDGMCDNHYYLFSLSSDDYLWVSYNSLLRDYTIVSECDKNLPVKGATLFGEF